MIRWWKQSRNRRTSGSVLPEAGRHHLPVRHGDPEAPPLAQRVQDPRRAVRIGREIDHHPVRPGLLRPLRGGVGA
jgi:hypothetical protein